MIPFLLVLLSWWNHIVVHGYTPAGRPPCTDWLAAWVLEKQSEYVLQVTAHEDLVRRQWNVLNHKTLHRTSHDALLVSE